MPKVSSLTKTVWCSKAKAKASSDDEDNDGDIMDQIRRREVRQMQSILPPSQSLSFFSSFFLLSLFA
jgi:hypothetical protein